MSRDPARLALSITSADGRSTRWGPDEPSAAEILASLGFGTSAPGGFKDLTGSLPRRIDREYPDLGLRDSVRVYGPGNETVWEGRVAQLPRSHGAGFGITPGAIGHAALLRGRPDFQEVYVDRDPASWDLPSLARQATSLASGRSAGDLTWTQQHGGWLLPFPTTAIGATRIAAELHYQGRSTTPVATLQYMGAYGGTPVGWAHELYSAVSDNSGFTLIDSDFNPDLDGSLKTVAAATGATRFFFYIDSNSSGFTPPAGSNRRLSALAVFGAHGLTRRTHTAGQPDGVYVTDVIADIVARTAPGLSFSTGAGGSIEPSTFIVPHLVFADATTGENAILASNAYLQWEWGVYDDREFFFRAPDPERLCWEVRLSDGAHLTLEGDSGEEVFNGVYVLYTDPDGNRKTVGPPGARADATDGALADTDPGNPVNAHGEIHWARLDIGQITTLAGATAIGAAFLAEKSRATRRGQLTVKGMGATHPTRGPSPVWRMRAGDHVRVADHSASVPRRIIETRYTHDGRQMTCSLDNTTHVIEAILERFGAALVGVV